MSEPTERHLTSHVAHEKTNTKATFDKPTHNRQQGPHYKKFYFSRLIYIVGINIYQGIILMHGVWCPCLLVEKEILQYVMFAGHQHFGRKTRKDGDDVRLRFSDHY